ncbi:unnamed protein product [Camellia sinensis]
MTKEGVGDAVELVWRSNWASMSANLFGGAFLLDVVGLVGEESTIDCGIPDGYTDETTSIYYSSDANFVDNGINSDISGEYKTRNLDRRLANLKSFPQGIRNCYTLRPQQDKNNNYLMRAWFLYGNYDGKNNRPRFDMYIGVNLWDRFQFLDDSEIVTKEIMYVASTNYIHVCVIDIGLRTPFISALELKHLNNSIYKSQFGGMVPYEQKYMGSYGEVDAMVNISLTYRVKKNWQGDPCKPMEFSWNNVNYSYNGNNSPKITSLNLSSSDLTGEIAPALFGLKSLKYLNLTSNNLTGSIPKALMEKSSLLLYGWQSQSLSVRLLRTGNKEEEELEHYCNSCIYCFLHCILSAIAILWSLKWRKHKGDRTLKLKNRRFSYSEVVSIINNFERVIGKGGFGTVYLGYLKDGTEVAVKMLSRSSSQGFEQFWTEAELLTTEDKKRAVLTWEQRLQIAIDAAQAFEYLHDGCKPPIIHKDIKTANILLNEKLQAKVADFGSSMIFPIEDGNHVSTAVVGTFGYLLDPEYYITSRLTEKSDVCSFGVVLFELITGQPAIIKNCDNENTHLVQWVMPMLERGEISNIVDPRLQGDFDSNSVWKTLETKMACVPPSPIQRPTMSRVVGELKECLEIHVAMSGKDLDMTEVNRMTSSNAIDNFASLDLESSMSFPQAREVSARSARGGPGGSAPWRVRGSAPAGFSSFGLPARAGKGTLERGLEALSISAVTCKNTRRCDFTLERMLLRSSASQFVRTQFLVSPLERAVLSSSGDRGTDSINLRGLYLGILFVYSEEFEPEAVVESRVALQKDNSVVKMGLEEAHKGWFN